VRFIEQFDLYTAFGADPKDYYSLRDLWRIQHRTMNWCHRTGILKRISVNGDSRFIVNPTLRQMLGLPDRKINMERFMERSPRVIKCNVIGRRRRTAALV